MATQQLIRPNPVMTRGFSSVIGSSASSESMTLQGTINCTAVLLFVVGVLGWVGWQNPNGGLLLGALAIAVVTGLVTTFKPHLAPKTGFVYAAAEGYVLGVISEMFDARYPGIVVSAVGLTFAIAVGLLGVYKSGIIKVTQNFRLAVAAATIGIFLFYLVATLLSFVGIEVSIIGSSSGWGIAFSVFVVILASANLVVDFDFVERGAAQHAPKYMEWYGAYSITVTLVWLYLELLRLLAKLQDR